MDISLILTMNFDPITLAGLMPVFKQVMCCSVSTPMLFNWEFSGRLLISVGADGGVRWDMSRHISSSLISLHAVLKKTKRCRRSWIYYKGLDFVFLFATTYGQCCWSAVSLCQGLADDDYVLRQNQSYRLSSITTQSFHLLF